MLQKIGFGILLSFTAAGCSVELQEKAQEPFVENFSVPELTPFPMKGPYYEIIPGSEPNEYVIHLNPPPGTKEIRKKSAEGIEEQVLQGQIDASLKAGSVYTYEFKGSENKKIEVAIPEDLFIDGIFRPESSVKNYRRLFFAKDAVLLTEGKDLEIFAEEVLVGSNARIQAFLGPAEEGKNGLSAGRLRFGTLKIQGVLKIDWQGQAGGPGISGTPYLERAAPGEPHKRGIIFGVGDCSQNLPGQRGSPGASGRDGAAGLAGGDGGRVEIFVPSEVRTQVKVQVEGGLGGVGGKGGPGQRGGLAGPSENYGIAKTDSRGNLFYEPCPAVAPLDEGVTGVAGRDGLPGSPGSKGSLFYQF